METFKQYKPFFVFLAKFFATYGLLALLYRLYLSQFDAELFQVDGFTDWVARQSRGFIEFMGYVSRLEPHPAQPSIKLLVNSNYVARVVEGCNALSVMILFAAFVVAFKGRWKTTLLYIVTGAALIHLLNIVRIGLLAIALLHYPEHEHLLHGVVFPAVIYGVVFLLWVLWVNRFSSYAEKK